MDELGCMSSYSSYCPRAPQVAISLKGEITGPNSLTHGRDPLAATITVDPQDPEQSWEAVTT